MRGRASVSLVLPTLNYGGVERVFMTLSDGLCDEGYDVELVTLRAFDDKAFSEQLRDGVRWTPLDAPRVRKSFSRLASYFRQNHPDVVITAQVNSAVLLAAKLARSGAKIVFTEHSIFSMEKKKLGAIRSRAYMCAARLFYPMADAVVAVSDGVRRDLADHGICPRENVTRIYNPVDVERVRRLSEAPADHRWLSEDRPVFLAVGRMESEKNFALLLEAFALLAEKRPDARLIVLGDGVLRGELERRAKELGVDGKTEFQGFCQNPFSYMASAKAVVVSSDYEGLSYAIIEGLACGAGIVSTDCPSGPREILRDGEYGLLSPVGDADALCENMLAILDKPFQRLHQRERAEDFGVKKIVAAYVRLIESLLAGRAASFGDTA